jgi:Tol biopolymer transport system component/DNA-binding winged helix-turn-helix (wHTH) protein
MSTASSTQPTFQQFVFDDVIVDRANFRVEKAGRIREITPRAFDVLVFLIENQLRVVEKSELIEIVWKEKFVSDNALSRAIKEVRHAIGDNAEAPCYIETIPRRGYRFISPVAVREFSPPRAEELLPEEQLKGTPQVANPKPTRSALRIPPLLLIVVGLAIALVVGLVLLRGRRPENRASGKNKPIVVRSAQITTWNGLDVFPALSPDGNLVAYSSDHNGKFEIYVRAVIPGAKENQLTSDGQQNLEPSWSPDGKWIAYYSQSRRGIWIIPASGGSPRQIIDFGSQPSWSPDSSRIVFQSDGLSDISTTSAAAPSSTIWTVSAQGGDAHQLTKPGNPLGGHGSPVWAPNGRSIAFVANTISSSSLWKMTATGTDLKRLTSEDREFYDPVYAPDGKFLLAVSGGVWQIPLSIDGEPSGEPEPIANPAMAQVRHLSFSADGKRVVSSVVRQKGNLWSVPISKTSAERTGQPAPFVEDTSARKTNPIFSNDGSKVAYTVWIAGFAGSVWTVGNDGSERLQVTTKPSTIVGWTREGNQLLSISFQEHEYYLTTTAVDTGMQKTLIKLQRYLPFCRLSPDGKTIAFNAYSDGSVNLWSYSVETGTEKQLTFDDQLFGFPAWSPDGKWLAGELKRDDDTFVAIVPAEGGTPVPLNSDRGQSWTGSWSPDGDKIAFAALRDGVWNIWWLSVSTRAQKQVTNYTKPNSFVRYPTWSPRGDQIVYEYTELTGNIWLADLK